MKYLICCRHIPQSEIAQSIQNEDNRSQRRLLLKKRSTSSACAVVSLYKCSKTMNCIFNFAESAGDRTL